MQGHRITSKEGGFAAIWVAMLLTFLIGATALAVDVSGFYQGARADQKTADLTCTGGVQDLPEDPAAALNNAVEYAKANWPLLQDASTLVSVDVPAGTATLDHQDGNSVTIEIVSPVKMKATINERKRTFFAAVFGAKTVDISQQAACQTFGRGLGVLPFGDLPSSAWDVDLQNPDSCGSDKGNCQRLVIERKPKQGANRTVAQNIAYGAERTLQIYDPLDGERLCSGNAAVDPCNTIETSTGNNDPQNTAGFLEGGSYGILAGDGRLENPTASTTWLFKGSILEDGEELEPTLATLLSTTTVRPDDAVWDPVTHTLVPWNDDVLSEWDKVKVIEELRPGGCESPRFAITPILVLASEYDDWKDSVFGSDPPFTPAWPAGKKKMRIVGFQRVFITQPDGLLTPDDDLGPGNKLEVIQAIPVYFLPSADCPGDNTAAVKPYESGDIKVVQLVAP